ncbi:ABC transporter permease [Agathobaculum sp. NTUH-O15-33]|uniref:ABC transporter permease n=1 Tax=Agathobaculum sp. NTUH-O15-33 TaxID=3079302 RepID=UPI002958A757|nr:ABC transporter permease [Agathobaculum sp. NTUH-O15-33]WNX85516.1 ABC transporter permease [Agathobaculum sp. NTUH-O15-33]
MKKEIWRRDGVLRFFKKNIAVDIIILFFIVAPFMNASFLSAYNLSQILVQTATTLIVAVGVMFVIITGESDLSIGGLMCLSGIVAIYLQPELPLPVILLIVMAMGCVLGCLTGLLVSVLKLDAFIVTLGIQMIYLGVNLIITDGQTVAGEDPAFVQWGTGKLFQFVPYAFVIALTLVVIAYWVLSRTQFGRDCYAVGGNYEVAKYAGIRVVRQKLLCYVICGCLAALAGFFLSARMNAGNGNFGTMIPFNVHCGIVIGGTYLSGGTGGAWHTLAGILMMSVLQNVMNIIGADAYIQQLVQGLIIVLIIGFACYEQTRKKQAA